MQQSMNKWGTYGVDVAKPLRLEEEPNTPINTPFYSHINSSTQDNREPLTKNIENNSIDNSQEYNHSIDNNSLFNNAINNNADYSIDNNNEIPKEENAINQENLELEKQNLIQKVLSKVILNKKVKQTFETPMIFESVRDANTILKVERKISDYLILIASFFFLTTLTLIILIIVLLPLKEKDPYLVTFANSTENFALIQKANSSITANKALVRQLLGAYILNRELINRIDDKERQEIVREQSSNEVWQTFENLVAHENSIYTNEKLTRNVKIVNIALIKKGYANADVEVTLYDTGIVKSIKRYRIIVGYTFEPIEIDFVSMPKNPTGFQVYGYSVTEIAVIKELDKENQVENPSSNQSKIHYKDNNETNNVNDYGYKQDKQGDGLEPNHSLMTPKTLEPNQNNANNQKDLLKQEGVNNPNYLPKQEKSHSTPLLPNPSNQSNLPNPFKAVQ
ncbi:type IV secretion system protein [Helicobacter cetorum]|uniref:type IV secretion system protein n=1 Tax=Helicobacter cetorum TaxID=138563 RepID=UPI000CF088DC|nr:VirB8/TrbF family protein [Helicobacter cetorum]